MTVELVLGDCLEFMKTLPDGCVDAVVTDPPYGIAHKRQPWRHGKARLLENHAIVGDSDPFDPTDFLDFPVVCLFGANHYADRLPSSPGWLVWDKRDGGTSDCCADVEVAWTNKDMPARLLHHKWRGMIKASEQREKRLHPTQKPIVLMKWVLDMLGIPIGATVFDPFMGSGTTGVACVQTGRNFIGCEIDEGYFNVAQRRIAEAQAQPALLEATI